MSETASSSWHSPPENPSVGPGEVHVWQARLDPDDGRVARCREALAPAEQERAESLLLTEKRERFIVARGWLRIILGRYLNRDPRELRFEYSEFGKPALMAGGDGGTVPLRFNVSHSGNLALYAVALCEVGVDVEEVREVYPAARVVRRFFSKPEIAVVEATPPEERAATFYALWTRKEAYVKATGHGLQTSLRRFAVSLSEETVRLLGEGGEAVAESLFTVRPLPVIPGYAAALATLGGECDVRRWQI